MFNYLKDVRAEMKHVSWPSRRLTIMYTLVVIVLSVATGLYLGALDYIFSAVVTGLV